MKSVGIIGLFILAIMACKKKTIPTATPIADDANLVELAGNCSIDDQTTYAFSYEINGLSSEQALLFYVGNSFFNQNWVETPSSTSARDGLGPLYNAQSCATCHFRDGRGAPMVNGGLLFRLGATADNSADPMYGGQLQDFSVLAAQPEGQMTINYNEEVGYYPDGTSYSLRVPTYSIAASNYGSFSATTGISPRVGQQMIGLGLLELIPESSLLANADPSDANGDGISGRANYALDAVSGNLMIGRFGWKANVPTIGHQVAGAFNGDIGITSTYFSGTNHTSNQTACLGLPDGGSPEIDLNDLNAVILYARSLAVPNRRDVTHSDVRAGALLFRSIGCVQCHAMNFTTGYSGDIATLKGQKITPYTDLLLHDMGSELADNVPDHLASGSEWRTAPLWGLGLISVVNSHTFLMHDGRARNCEEAILWHGGEGSNSRAQFKALTATQRAQVIRYLNSL
jgi:CxxC motif-containing protein (DUF1111 family)